MNYLQKSIAYLVIASFLLIFIIVIGLIFYCLRRDSSDETMAHKYYDSCDSRSAKHKYLVELTFGEFTKSFDLQNAVISVNILNTKRRFIGNFKIKSQLLNKTQTEGYKTVKILVYTREKLEDIDKFKFDQNCFNGDLFIHKLEIQDVTTGTK